VPLLPARTESDGSGGAEGEHALGLLRHRAVQVGSPRVPATRSGQTTSWVAPADAVATGSPARIAASTASGSVSTTSGCTRTSMVPPQVRPTAKASSSPTPYVSVRAWPVCMASWQSSYTAPSTHPPEMLPTTSPSAQTAMAAPGGLGADLQVRTTVATANRTPADDRHEPVVHQGPAGDRRFGHRRQRPHRDVRGPGQQRLEGAGVADAQLDVEVGGASGEQLDQSRRGELGELAGRGDLARRAETPSRTGDRTSVPVLWCRAALRSRRAP